MIEVMLLRPQVSGPGLLHPVVLDPATRLQMRADPIVLDELPIGDRAGWDGDYATFALEGARLIGYHGMDSRRLQMPAPHLLNTEDSLVCDGEWPDGMVVAANGAIPIWDEAFALAAAAQLRVFAWDRAHQGSGR